MAKSYAANHGKEVWQRFGGLPFEASSLGRIRCADYHPKTPERLIPARRGKGGWKYVDLEVDGRLETRAVHQLVAEAFLDEGVPFNVRHLNGDRTDNRLCNLRLINRCDYQRTRRQKAAIFGDGKAPHPDLLLTWLLYNVQPMHRTLIAKACEISLSRVIYFQRRIELGRCPGLVRRILKRVCPDPTCRCGFHTRALRNAAVRAPTIQEGRAHRSIAELGEAARRQ